MLVSPWGMVRRVDAKVVSMVNLGKRWCLMPKASLSQSLRQPYLIAGAHHLVLYSLQAKNRFIFLSVQKKRIIFCGT